jgi:hypothetical protein
MVINGGFEDDPNIIFDLPNDYGYWAGNYSEVVGKSDGITPVEGSKMLHFIHASYGDSANESMNGELWQIIDISAFAGAVNDGNARAWGWSSFNRVAGNANTDTEFLIGISAYQGDPCNFDLELDNIASVSSSIISDGNTSTWEYASTTLFLPAATDFIVVKIAASENVVNNTNGVEFDGHYGDTICICVTVGPAQIYVDANAPGPLFSGSSWQRAFRHLRDALDIASYGDEILVAEGTYRPDSNAASPTGTGYRNATFQLVSGVTIYGGFPSGGGALSERDPNRYKTILSGDLLENDGPDFANNAENSYHVVTGSGTDPNAVLDGFTITAGNAGGILPYNYGGGMYNDFGSPTVSNCTFSGNSAKYGGGAFNNHSSPIVTNCTFSGNRTSHFQGGGMCNDSSNPIVMNCKFIGNLAAKRGGGIANKSSDLNVINCIFSSNSANTRGGGMTNELGSDSNITNCTFSGNSAGSYGGGMYSDASNPIITNCTFINNTATLLGGGMCNGTSDLIITNCILWANSDSGGMDESAQIFTNDDPGVVVDDMESYNDFDNNIFYTWCDGGCNWSGSMLSLGTAPDSVLRGAQSMEFFYENSIDYTFGGHYYSEAERVFESPQDWASLGTNRLTLYFHGKAGNAAGITEQMYIALEDSLGSVGVVTYGGDANDVKLEEWQTWNITMSTFSGVDANNIKKIYIGFGDRVSQPVQGGDGIVYFDDIRFGSVVEIDYSCVQGWTGSLGGTGNIGDDPLFFDANNPDPNLRDYHLRAGSLCIDAGDNNSVPADVADIDGDGNTVEAMPWDLDRHYRISDGDCDGNSTVDMGVYELVWSYLGDFDGDCDVDLPDFSVFGSAWKSGEGDGHYNQICDISVPLDLYIDLRDLKVLCENWLAGK